MSKTNTKSLITTILLIVVFLTSAIVYSGVNSAAKDSLNKIKINGVYLNTPMSIKNFTLQATTGKKFTEQSLKGHWSMLFFGFTNCGSICPTTMSALNRMYVKLQAQLPAKDLPMVVMVSVDPARDSLDRMSSFVRAYNNNFIGVIGNETDTTALEKDLHIVAIKSQGKNSEKNNYVINHTAEIMLFNPEGKLQAYLSSPYSVKQLIKDYKLIINN